jgi:hypothetical protein
MTKERIYRLTLVVLMLAIIFLVWDGCSKEAQLSSFKENIQKLKLGNQTFKKTISKKNEKIAEQKQIILSQEDAVDQELLMINDFKKLKAQVKVINRTIVDSIYVPFEVKVTDTFLVNAESDKPFSFNDEYFGIYGTAKKNGILLDSVYFINDLTLTIGNKSKGFLKKSEPIIQVKYNNPYTTTTSMNNVIVQNDLKWYDRKMNWFLIGAGLATITMILIP